MLLDILQSTSQTQLQVFAVHVLLIAEDVIVQVLAIVIQIVVHQVQFKCQERQHVLYVLVNVLPAHNLIQILVLVVD